MAGATALPAGSPVRLASGRQRPVEELAPGTSLDGGAVVVSVTPLPQGAVGGAVCLSAGALGDGSPAADIVLAPLQWVVLAGGTAPEGGLRDVAPAGALANGVTIRRLSTTPAEWYAVTSDRASTLTTAGVRLPLSGADGLAADFRPLPAGPELEAIRVHLCPPPPPLLRLMLGAQELPLTIAADRVEATLPSEPQAPVIVMRLVSPPGRPRGTSDLRRFGIAIRGLELDGKALPLDDPGFGDGFYPVEHHDHTSWRWTNGNASLTLPASTASRSLVLHLTSWHTHLDAA